MTAADLKTRREYLAAARQSYPQEGQPAAAWARSLEAGWRCACWAAHRNPADTGDVCRTDPPTQAEAEEADRFRVEASRQAEIARANGSPFPHAELAESWLALQGRAPNGRRFAD